MSKEELTAIVTKRYFKTRKRQEKSIILDEFCQNTGYHRKYAIAKLKQYWQNKDRTTSTERYHLRKYGHDLDQPLLITWQAMNGICAERLQPFLSEILPILRTRGHLSITDEQQAQLIMMSIATIKRRLRSMQTKHKQKAKGLCATKPGFLLKHHIPIQTICWDQEQAGFCEIDLVAHCGGSLSGDFIYTLQFVDIKTTWTERKAVMGKGQSGVFAAIKAIRIQLPFNLLGVDSDNGSEFINHQLWKYCQEQNIVFTRSRPYMSKDGAHVEQKNYTTVRKVLGYDRFDTQEQLKRMNDLYNNELCWYLNFFQPSLKLREKKKVGSKYKRIYDKAKTPYQRVMACSEVPQNRKERLKAFYETLDPVELRQAIERKVLRIIVLSRK